MKKVSVFMDVEDPINPASDDAALDLANLFTAVGVRGSFCLTGEKCRTLRARGRDDIREAFEPHCLGLHTDTHSQHPTTMELLADLSWEEGCAAAYDAESRGNAAFLELFDRTPAFWGGAGNTWSPEITDALKRLGIPGYVYALTGLPGEPVHQFNGVPAFPQHLSISEDDWADDDRASHATQRVLRNLVESSLPWQAVFVGHPTRFRHVQYWDIPYFNGRTPAAPEFTEEQPLERYERAKQNLRTFLYRLAGAATVVGLDEVEVGTWREPTEDELSYFQDHTARSLHSATGWPVHRAGIDPENMIQKTLALCHTVRVAG